jgi:hypothetical protein
MLTRIMVKRPKTMFIVKDNRVSLTGILFLHLL